MSRNHRSRKSAIHGTPVRAESVRAAKNATSGGEVATIRSMPREAMISSPSRTTAKYERNLRSANMAKLKRARRVNVLTRSQRLTLVGEGDDCGRLRRIGR